MTSGRHLDGLKLELLAADKLANRGLDAVQATNGGHNWSTKTYERLEVAQCLGILATHWIVRGGACGMEQVEEIGRPQRVALDLVLGKLPPKLVALGGRIIGEGRTDARNPIENRRIIHRGTTQLGPVLQTPATDHIVDRGRSEAFVVGVGGA